MDRLKLVYKILVFLILFISTLFISPRIIKADLDNVSCVPVPEGLVYWLRAENNSDDWTGNHNGTLYGGTSFTTGMVGNAFSFDGEDDSVIIPSASDLPHGADPRTIEMWIYSVSDSWMRDTHPVFHSGAGSFHNAFGIDFDNYPLLQFYTWADDLIISTSLSEVGWFHVAMVYDGITLLSVYINGVLSDSRTLSDFLNTENLDTYIGSGIDSNGIPKYFIGNIDEISMYNRALSEPEIFSIYNAGSYGKCSNIKPIANAGPDQTVDIMTLVTLDGSLSSDPDNNLPLSYFWEQIEGETVELNDPTIPYPAFIAPDNPGKLSFSLVVTDDIGLESDPDIVEITVKDYKIFIPIVFLY